MSSESISQRLIEQQETESQAIMDHVVSNFLSSHYSFSTFESYSTISPKGGQVTFQLPVRYKPIRSKKSSQEYKIVGCGSQGIVL